VTRLLLGYDQLQNIMGGYAGYIRKRAFQIDKGSFQQFLQSVDFAGALFHPALVKRVNFLNSLWPRFRIYLTSKAHAAAGSQIMPHPQRLSFCPAMPACGQRRQTSQANDV
jgi:hypothetical protein